MAVTRYYVDPVVGSNANSGTSAGDAWLDLTNFGSTAWPGGAVQINIVQGLVSLTSRLDIELGTFYSATSALLEIVGSSPLAAAGFQKADQLLTFWARPLRLFNLRMKLTGVASSLANFQTGNMMDRVYFENVGGGSGFISGGVVSNSFLDCVFDLAPVYTYARLERCLLINSNAQNGDLIECRLIRTTGSTALWSPSGNVNAVRCAFVRLGSAANTCAIVSGSVAKVNFEGCVFANFATCLNTASSANEACISRRNALYNCTTFTSMANHINHDANITLVDDPYADPANDDWTPSAELAALNGTPEEWPDGVDTRYIIGPVRTSPANRVVVINRGII